jgi:thiol-disulfide isomerase/thioredoxin
MRLPAFLAALALTAAPALAAVPAPRMKAQSFEQLAKPLPLPYDEAGVGLAAVEKARARAKASGKLLLIDLGGNWCLDCRILAGTVELPELKGWVKRHYELVTVDVGRFDKNLEVPAHYGIRDRLKGVPSLLVVDPKSDRLINAGDTAALSDARSMNPQGLADYLAHWAR